MPTVPMVRLDDWSGVQLPAVMSVDATPLARGRQAVGRGLADLGEVAGQLGDLALRLRERRTQEEASALVDEWRMRQVDTWDGRPGEDGTPERGVKEYSAGDPSAVEAMQQAWRGWRDDPEGAYRKASAEARARADRVLMLETNRIFSLAAQKDLATAELQRQQAAQAALATAARSTTLYALNDELFEEAAGAAADEAARLKLGRLIENPGAATPQELRFKSADGAALYGTTRSEVLEELRHKRALTLAESAGVAESEGAAAVQLEAAERVAEGLAPGLRADVKARLKRVKAERLEGMLGAARAEMEDLDRRERLAEVALAAAKGYRADGKLMGMVKEEAARIKEGAQKEENERALAALAQGQEYEAGENERRKTALTWAQGKQQEYRARELAREMQQARSELARELAAQEKLTAAMAGSGVWADTEGNVAPVGIREQRSILRGLLAQGQIREGYFLQEMRRLESVEARGLERQYEAAKGLVAEALGQEIATVHRAGKVALAAGVKKPQERVAKYRYMEDGKRRKAELLAEGVPQLIELLMVADRADGLMVDLDGNPQTELTRLDAREYRQKLLRELKQGLLQVDLDTQYGALVGAVEAAAVEERVLAGKAMLKNARLGLPAAAAAGEDMDNERLED